MRGRLYAHALRVARARQVRGRLTRVVTRRLFPGGDSPPFAVLAGPRELWRSEAFAPVELAGYGDERLRSFHRHYGEDALAAARAGDAPGVREAMRGWIEANPPRRGDAWHPYPTSTRLGNWVAALSLAPDAIEAGVTGSMWRQLRHVALNVEHDVLGNHVVRNARALVLGGSAFGAEAVVRRGARILVRELPEQVLADGGHYERSPTYHGLVLRDLLEVRAVLPEAVPADPVGRMSRFAAALARPDGAPALFNDGGVELAPRLGLPPAPEGLAVFPDTGYAVLREGDLWLAFDCGPFAPAYLPPHAHADALSVHVWWRGRPVVVDPGTSTYEPGPVRDRERGTVAHATVALDGRDQFTVWGAFRAGPFPRVELLEASPLRLRARVRWHHGVVHTRAVEIGAREVSIVDELDGQGRHDVVSTLPLADDTNVEIEPLGPLPAVREPHERSERFFAPTAGPALVLRGELSLPETIGWRISLC